MKTRAFVALGQRMHLTSYARWFAGLAVVMAPAEAWAAEPSAADRETSRGLYAQGMQSLDARDYATAERACGGAYALVKVPTAATCWARALEGVGKLIEARDVFVEATHIPAKPDEPAVLASAREAAKVEADGLAKRIPTVTLALSGPSETAPLQVVIDGVVVKSETARLPRKVNPGRHTIAVSAPGFGLATTDVTVAEGEDRRIEVLLGPSTVSPGPGPAAHPVPSQAHAATASRPVPMLAIVAGGVGLAGLLVGVGAGAAGSSKHSTLSGECDTATGTCPPAAASDLDAFHALRSVSTVGYVVGALGLVAGGVLFFAMPTSKESPASAALYVGPASCRLAWTF